MSRIGKAPVALLEGVKATLAGSTLTIVGPKGELTQRFRKEMDIKINENEIVVTRKSDDKVDRELHGLTRSLISNMVEGVKTGYKKKMSIIGIGFSAVLHGDKLILELGYTHSIVFNPPDGIHFIVEKPTGQDKAEFRDMQARLIITGIDKQLVGQICAKIKSFRPPEPYKGKGIRFDGEYVRKKAGKQIATGT